MPKTTKREYILPTEETLEEIKNIWIKYLDSVVELGEGSKLVGANIQVDGQTHFDSISFDTEIEEGPTETGSMFWDNQDKTVAIVLEPSNGGVVKLQLGQETYVRGVNKTGTTISNGSVVFISGSQGNRPTIELAEADVYENASKTIGVATEDIGNNLYGYVTIQGVVRDLNTADYTEGDCVYLSETAGAFTTVTPADGNARVRVGVITKAQNNDGALQVCIKEDKYMFGAVDDGNYSYFEADGTKVSVGNATVWDDVNGSALQVKVQGSGLSINSTENTLDFTTSSNLSDYGFDNYQTPHSMKLNSMIYPHIHWIQKEDATPNFLIQYRYQGNGNTSETDWVNYKCNTNAFAYTTGSINQISYGEGIAGDGLSSIIQFRIFRDNSNASTEFAGNDSYSQTANITFIDIHVEKDTEGSRQQYTK